jgi:hypothetical protein
VSEHLNVICRGLHVLGATAVIACVASALMDSPLWLLVAPLAGYGPSWIGHLVFEKNRPATWRNPIWSLRGDFEMFALIVTGRMGPELARARAWLKDNGSSRS